MIKAVIFDFDGLIIDTESADYLSWQETYTAYGCELPLSLWLANIGSLELYFDPASYLAEKLGPRHDWEEILIERKRRDTELCAALPILPGVLDYLADAKRLGMKVAIASSSPQSWLCEHLPRLGLLEQFDVICGSDDVNGRSKPDPAVYLAALQRLGVAPHQAIALEDSPIGLLAASRAGLFTVVAPNEMTSQLTFDQTCLRLPSLAALPLETVLARINQLAAR